MSFHVHTTEGNNGSTPTVSVGIPTFNRVHFLRRAIQSVVDQTYSDIEIIVVDDGSSDETRSILTELQETVPRLRVILHPSNMGMGESWCDAFEAASGEFYALLPDDDYWDKDFVRRAVDALNEHSQCVVAFCNLSIVDASDRILAAGTAEDDRRWSRDKLNPGLMPNEEYRRVCFVRQSIPANGALFRTASLVAARAYDRRAQTSMDYYITCRTALLPQSCAFWLPDRLLYYRVHGGSATATKRLETSRAMQQTVRVLMQDVHDTDLRPALRKRLHAALLSEASALMENRTPSNRVQIAAVSAIRLRPWHPRGYVILVAAFLPYGWQQFLRQKVRNIRFH
jgi:glycosyltransferase involved in cell wall biosynthesis